MRIVIAGGHGQVARPLERLLVAAGHEPVGMVRSQAQAEHLEEDGVASVMIDLEDTDVTEMTAAVQGADAVVFAAGGGPDGNVARKETVDKGAAIMLAEAAAAAGVRRYVMVSSMNADKADPDSEDVFQVYLRAKHAADDHVRASDLDWTIVRPGRLTDDDPTGPRAGRHAEGRRDHPRRRRRRGRRRASTPRTPSARPSTCSAATPRSPTPSRRSEPSRDESTPRVPVALLAAACSLGGPVGVRAALRRLHAGSGPMSTPACAEVRAGIDEFNAQDFDAPSRTSARPCRSPRTRPTTTRPPQAEDLLEAVRYYADLAPEDYLEASASSPEFAKYKAITLGQCASPAGPSESPGPGTDT